MKHHLARGVVVAALATLVIGCGSKAAGNIDRDHGDDAPGGDSGDQDTSGDSDEPSFPIGDVTLTIDGASLTVRSERAVQTSAGVYDSEQRLVRTLWSGKSIAAGESYVTAWDHRDDAGIEVADGVYSVTVVAHNVAYDWEGVVGNSSHPGAAGVVSTSYSIGGVDVPLATVPNIHRAISPLTQMALGNGRMYLASSGASNQTQMARFELGASQVRTPILRSDFPRVFALVTADDTTAYYANIGSNSTFNSPGSDSRYPESFIIGVNASDDSEVQFPAGSEWTHTLGAGPRWSSVIDPVADGSDPITGLAVERGGSHLYVAHESSGIKIIDKTSGVCANTSSPYAGNCGSSIDVPSPSAMAIAPNGDLWVIANGTEARCYHDPAGSATLTRTIPGFTKAIAIGVSPTTSTVVVLDGGQDAQQLLGYSASDGSLLWTHGKRGGYSPENGPEVTPDKLDIGGASIGFIAFEPASAGGEAFWTGEPGNLRNLKLLIPAGASGADPLVLEDVIMFIPNNYVMAVDHADPRRVFSGYLEMSVDYTEPLPRSWKLERNWDLALPYVSSEVSRGFADVLTYSGHTFATVTSSARRLIVELAPGGVRETGIELPFGTRLYADGAVRYGVEDGGVFAIHERRLTGVDGAGNPIFSDDVVVASVPMLSSAGVRPPLHGPCNARPQEPMYPKTSSDLLITFDPCAFADGDYDPTANHLGGVRAGGSDLAFSASPGGAFTLRYDRFPTDHDGVFELEHLQNLLTRPTDPVATIPLAAGRHVIYDYAGPYWKGSRSANQWLHWLDNGLFVGQFGVPAYTELNRTTPLAASAAMAYTAAMVEVGGAIFVYHSDSGESAHGGVHRWRLRNLGSIQKMTGAIGKNQTVDNPSPIPGVAY